LYDILFQKVAARWKEHIDSQKWKLEDNFYWNSYQPFWEGMPSSLVSQLKSADVVIIKGDANYRRVHGDLHWSVTHPTHQITGYFPAPFVMLRTLKSEVQTGLSTEALERVKNEPDWMYSGKFAILQYIKK
jgi:hypothetical protein